MPPELIWVIWLERVFLLAAGIVIGMAIAVVLDLRAQRRNDGARSTLVKPDGSPIDPEP